MLRVGRTTGGLVWRAARAYCSAGPAAYEQLLGAEYSFLKMRHEEATRSLWVTLARPEVHNAFSDKVIGEVTRAFRQLGLAVGKASAPGLPCSVVFTGCGSSDRGIHLGYCRRMPFGLGGGGERVGRE